MLGVALAAGAGFGIQLGGPWGAMPGVVGEHVQGLAGVAVGGHPEPDLGGLAGGAGEGVAPASAAWSTLLARSRRPCPHRAAPPSWPQHESSLRTARQWVKQAHGEQQIGLYEAADLLRLPRGYVRHYNEQRPHRSLALYVPEPRERNSLQVNPREVRRRDVLGGLIHEYHEVAA